MGDIVGNSYFAGLVQSHFCSGAFLSERLRNERQSQDSRAPGSAIGRSYDLILGGQMSKICELSVQLQWVLIPVFCALTGYSEKAVRRKIEDGVWLQGKHFCKAPDGRITMNVQEYYKWVEQAV